MGPWGCVCVCVCVCVCAEVVWREGCSEADWLRVEDGPLVGAQEQSSKEAMVRDAGGERTTRF